MIDIYLVAVNEQTLIEKAVSSQTKVGIQTTTLLQP
jgi:hypothetical protein